MPFSIERMKKLIMSYPLRVTLIAILWFFFISIMHYKLNVESQSGKVVRMGYMPVITNMAAPILDFASIKSQRDISFKAIKFASFAEMAEALRNNKIHAAFIIAPLAVVLRQQGVDVKVVYIGNRHESTLVARKGLNIKKFKDLAGHTVAVPMRYSGHNLSLLELRQKNGLGESIRIVEMNPPDMASAMAAGSLDAYYVGEPFAAKTLKAGIAELVFYVEKVWPGFICNLLLIRDDLIKEDYALVKQLVQGAARTGLWAKQHRNKAAEIVSKYWGQPKDLVDFALNTPQGRIVFDKFVPVESEMQQIADLMMNFGLIKNADITGLIDDRFARSASLENISNEITSVLNP
ncbi:MAG: ABC transporter substrate-binding protein [Desulfobacteraceae bacterium]|nr:ABC transporter substrate-binding protein [Desulfobacteraceae bacterium]